MWALSRGTADPPGQLITGVPGRGNGPDGLGCIGECWGQADDGVEGGKRRKSWQKKRRWVSEWEGWLEGSTGKFGGLVLP